MSPEAADYLRHAKLALSDAQSALKASIYRLAAREAYIAALNAARAIIFEKLTIASKSHSGTHSLFHQLVQNGLVMDRYTLEILAKGFDAKNNADYGPYEDVSEAKAQDFVGRADLFVAQVEAELAA